MFLIPNPRRCQAGSGQCVIDKVKECFSNSCQIERILQNVVEEKKIWWPYLTHILLGASKSVSSLSAKEMPPNGNEQRWWEKLKEEYTWKKKRILRNNKIIPPAVQNERQPRNTATIRPETLKVFTLNLTLGRSPLQIQMSLFGPQYYILYIKQSLKGILNIAKGKTNLRVGFRLPM